MPGTIASAIEKKRDREGKPDENAKLLEEKKVSEADIEPGDSEEKKREARKSPRESDA